MKVLKNYKDLTAEDIEYIRHIYYSERIHKEKTDIIGAKFGIAERTVRKWWENLDLNKVSSNLPIQLQAAEKRALKKDTKVVLVTTAQNKTAVNKDFFNNLKTYQSYIENELGKKCEIIVIPSRYRNPTSNIENEKDIANDWWEDEINDYLYYGSVEFGDCLISADSRISPTASEPLNGYELLTSNGHLILGHSRLHFRVIPRLRKQPLRTMCTTGYLTTKNYSKSRAGNIAYQHHSYGFCVLELKDDNACYIPRLVKVTKDGNFTDLIFKTETQKVSTIDKSLGLVWGDIHARQVNRDFLKVTLDLAEKLKPKIHTLHDIFDGSTVNPHESKDMFLKRLKISEGKHLIEDEVEEALDLIEEIKNCCNNVAIVESNHDIFLQRYLDTDNWKNDLHNSPAYLKYALIQQTVDLRKYGNVFGYLIHDRFGEDVQYVKMGDSLKIGEYECGLHGDYSSNGSKGSTKGFSRLNLKMIHAHIHTASIHNNVTSVGVTANVEQYYNRKGLSSWCYAHSVVHDNGKNQLLVFTDDYKLSGLI